MQNPKAIPCRITWCDATEHTPDRFGLIHHRAGVAAFTATDGSTVNVYLAHAEHPEREHLEPHIVVRRSAGTLDAQVDLVPGEAMFWAELFAVLDGADLPGLVAALTESALILDQDAEAGQ